jgi:hypothetical protein
MKIAAHEHHTLIVAGLLRDFQQRNALLLITFILVAGCTNVPVIGLQPEYPPYERGSFSLWAEFVEVESLQPTLRWQQYPTMDGRGWEIQGKRDQIQDVRYELRVWTTVDNYMGTLVYSRSGLDLPYHEIEQPLEPATQYQWTVRAWFSLDGRVHATEWGLTSHLLRGYTVPNPSCYRFSTPTSIKNGSRHHSEADEVRLN